MDKTQENETGKLLKRLEALEYHAWRCYEEAAGARDRMAALKLISELVLSQIKLHKESVCREEVEGVEFYEEQLRELGERVGEFLKRRGRCGQQKMS